MRLSQKLLLFVLAAAIVPLAFAGFWSLRQAEVELSARLEREQRALASAAAEAAGTQLSASLDALSRSALLIDWPRVTEAEAVGGLRLLAGQSSLVVSATFVDPTRAGLTPLVDAFEDRPVVRLAREGLLAPLPLATLGTYGDAGQVAIGPVQVRDGTGWVPVAIQVGPRGAGTQMVVLALSLALLDRWLVEHASPGSTLEVVDGDGRVVASNLPRGEVRALDPGRAAAVRAGLPLGVSGSEQLAVAKVPGTLGLVALVSVPLDTARAPLLALRRTVLGGMAATVLLLVVVSVLFSGRLTRRLEDLAAVADAFGKGELSRRATLGGADELAALAGAFNAMGSELETSRAKLLRWNDELAQKVDEATAELRAAQAQLLEAQKLAAIGQLGAGVAHEINNPLVGILGSAQLLLMDHGEGDADFSLLKQIEDSAKRCRDITGQLLRFSQKRGEVSLVNLDLVPLLQRVAVLERDRGAAEGVAVELSVPEGELRVDGDPEQLEQVLTQLFVNARTAMKDSPSKKITLSARATPEGAAIEVTDTGKGVPLENLERIFEPFFTTKDVWTNIGLGLAVAYRVLDEHEGRIEVASQPGQGARFTLSLKAVGTTRMRHTATGPAQAGVGGVGKGITG